MDNSTTYSIYRIVNFRNGKMYVGQTSRTDNRYQWHFGALKKGNHHSRKLQGAYNKYGDNAFYFEIVERDIPADQIDKREIHWIAYYDSFHNGYNMTQGGQDSGGRYKPVTIGNTRFDSKQDAADATGLSIRDIDVHLRKQGIPAGNYKKPVRTNGRGPRRPDHKPTREELTEMAIRLGLLPPEVK